MQLISRQRVTWNATSSFQGSQRVYTLIAPYIRLYEPRIDEMTASVSAAAERGAAQLGERGRAAIVQASGDVVNYVRLIRLKSGSLQFPWCNLYALSRRLRRTAGQP